MNYGDASWRPLTLALAFFLPFAASAAEVVVDCGKELPKLKAINGLNCGPVELQGLIDLTPYYKAMRPPLLRLHDCNWPNPDVVDVSTIFADFSKDAERPESYDFVRTDEYVRTVLATGGKIVWRLGESIEHGKDKRKCAPPADVEKWARVCVNIIRHYNEGWAGGFQHGIEYWEIWNEPENRPYCWTGTDEDYYRLYAAAAKAIKREFPKLKVGGPAGGNVVVMEKGKLVPTPFIRGLLTHCKKEGAAIDFFSWHRYGTTVEEYTSRARAVRRMLDEAGFDKAESHLNEWNYLPDGDWTPVSLKGQGLMRKRWAERMASAEAAAFAGAVLIALADEPLDVANFYAGNTLGFGMFDANGVPRQTVGTFKAFASLAELPTRVSVSGGGGGGVVGSATKGDDEVRVLLAHFTTKATTPVDVTLVLKDLPWADGAAVSVAHVDESVAMKSSELGKVTGGRVAVKVEAPGVSLVVVRRGRGD